VPTRVSPTDRIRRHIDDLFAEDRPLPEILEDVARLGAQLLMQAALEAEVTEFLGRDRYQRAAGCQDARDGSRNGYRDVTVKTTAGPVALARPKLRGTTEAFASGLFGSHVTKTNALESLVIASFIRGLPVRDVEATLAEALGDQAAISKSTVSAICGQITGTSPNLIMKPGTTPADLHRNPDVHVSPGTVLVRRRHRARQVITCPGVDVARLQAHDRRAGRLPASTFPSAARSMAPFPSAGTG
jgi:hypothetical protein